MSAAPHPTNTARRVAEAAALILNLTAKVEEHAARVLVLHRAGKSAAADAARGLRDRYDQLLVDAHHKADIAYGAATIRRAVTVERRRRAAAHQAEVA